jgi:glycine/D-amino acid oxidase-like deaminating enzyme
MKIPSKDNSYWLSSTKDPKYPTLRGELEVDVAIVGGGIAGLTTAYLLKQKGLKVVVLEEKTVASGVTGHTTGKVTSQHNLCYYKIQKDLGTDTAKAYGKGNQAAIVQIEEIIKKEKINCDWQRDDNYVFTENPEEVEKLKKEAKIAKQLDLPATYEKETPLPFPIAGAIKFTNQAKFHSRKYCLGLAKAINGKGSFVFENSKVTGVTHGKPCTVKTKNGKVIAKDVVIATNVPFPLIAHGLYCGLEYPLSSYIVAGPNKIKLKGMYINTGSPLRSILPFRSGNDDLLLVGGESHIPYLGRANPRYQKLAMYAKEKFGLKDIKYRWSAMDYLAYDGVPLIGKLYPNTPHLYVTTAYFKWGLTNTTMSAMILSDLIVGNKNPWARHFDTMRLSPVTNIPKLIARTIGLSKD